VSGFRERIFQFGENQNLVGILTEPASAAGSQKPVLIFLNAGVVHHIGPFRAFTDFARALVDDGFCSFRFDFSGIGDSNLGKSQVTAEQRFIDDAKAAMDLLQAQLGTATRFILFGLCTGADNAHKIAAVDNRVSGAIFIDGYTYPSAQFMWRRILPVLLNPRRLLGVLYRIFHKPPAETTAPAPIEDSIFTWRLPPKEKAVEEWTQMLGNGMQMLFIYTGGAYFSYNYEAQLFDAIAVLRKHRDKVAIKLFMAMDHTFTLSQDRRELLANVRQWLERF